MAVLKINMINRVTIEGRAAEGAVADEITTSPATRTTQGEKRRKNINTTHRAIKRSMRTRLTSKSKTTRINSLRANRDLFHRRKRSANTSFHRR